MPNWKHSSMKTRRNCLPLLLAALFLVVSAVLSLCLGAAGLSLGKLWAALISGPDGSAAARIFLPVGSSIFPVFAASSLISSRVSPISSPPWVS